MVSIVTSDLGTGAEVGRTHWSGPGTLTLSAVAASQAGRGRAARQPPPPHPTLGAPCSRYADCSPALGAVCAPNTACRSEAQFCPVRVCQCPAHQAPYTHRHSRSLRLAGQ